VWSSSSYFFASGFGGGGGGFPWLRSCPVGSQLVGGKQQQQKYGTVRILLLLLVLAVCSASFGISKSLTLVLFRSNTTGAVISSRAATRRERRSFREEEEEEEEEYSGVKTGWYVPPPATKRQLPSATAAMNISSASFEQLRERKKTNKSTSGNDSTSSNHNVSRIPDSNNRTLPSTNQSSSVSTNSSRKKRAAKPKEIVLAGWPHEVWLRQKNRLHLWANAYSMSAKHQRTRRALLQTYFTVVWKQSSLLEIQQLLNRTTTKGRSFQWLFPEHWNNATALQEVYRRAALDVSENPLAIYYIEENDDVEAISSEPANRSKPPPRFRFDPLPSQDDEYMKALNAFVSRHSQSCAGKERWLRELQFAGALSRTNLTASADAAICRALPTEQEVQKLYGKGPIVLGLDRCEQYRRQLHTALRKEMKLIPVHFPPRAKVAGLWNSGTTALSQSFVLNLHNYQSDAPIYVPTVTWGKHTPLLYRLKTTWPPGNRESRNHILPVLIVRDPYRWLQSMASII